MSWSDTDIAEVLQVPEDHHILIVDDDEGLRRMVSDYLQLHRFVVHEAGDGSEMLEKMESEPISLVLLDLMLPGEDGFVHCRDLRSRFDIGIIMLTGVTDLADRVVGLELGADDYISKPFEPRELLARIRSVLRRSPNRALSEPSGSRQNRIRFGTCQLELNSRTLRDQAGQLVPLTRREFELLKLFAEHPNQVFTRDRLLDLAHDRDWEPYDRSIDVRVNRLRKKIEHNPARPMFIRTVRGIGYKFCPQCDDAPSPANS